MYKILRLLPLVAVLSVMSASAGTPISDWVDSNLKQYEKVLADTKASEVARCGMQTDVEARSECVKAFRLIGRHYDVLQLDLEKIRDIDNVKNPVLRQKLLNAESAAFKDDITVVKARLLAIEDIFKTNLAAR